MPQIKLEYTDNLRPKSALTEILKEIHRIISNATGIEIEHCKSRATKLTDYCTGKGGNHKAFVHLEVCLFAGREVDIKKKIGMRCLQHLEKHFETLGEIKNNLQITVEFRDMDKAGYFKLEG